ncbi:MAG: hypothetical protein KDB03_14290 [Planctomycetales bacterium]|nr:hypothetical protein [Planctomycetales bacterium]
MKLQLWIRLVITLITWTSLSPNAQVMGQTLQAAKVEQLCLVDDDRISEASGLAISQFDSDLIWIHNDSDDSARLFLVGLDGKSRAVFDLVDERVPVDWEDMCSFSINETAWLLVGDVGDNAINRHLVTPDIGQERACRLLLMREPKVPLAPTHGVQQANLTIAVHSTILFEYEDGPRNCESVAVDTERQEILLVSKSKSTPLDCGVYRIPLTLDAGTTIAVAERIGSLNLAFAAAMDIAPNNRRMVIISSLGASIVNRNSNESWSQALNRDIQLFELPKREAGETVCFGHNELELYLNSEHTRQPLWRVTLPSN